MKIYEPASDKGAFLFDVIGLETPETVKQEVRRRLNTVTKNNEKLIKKGWTAQELAEQTCLPFETIDAWLCGWNVEAKDKNKIEYALQTKPTINLSPETAAVSKNANFV